MLPDLNKLHPVDDAGMLFISPAIHHWSIVTSYGVDTVLDMDGGIDDCIPTHPNGCLYVYFPIFDEGLPNLEKLAAVASLGAHLIENGHRVLSHCGMGYNRSALVAGRIMHKLGMKGPDIVDRLRERRPGALFNEVFAEHLRSLE